ncbi:MAG: ribonuclease III [Bacteriovoracia bacterium]
MNRITSLKELTHQIKYEFQDNSLLEIALVHKSYGNERHTDKPISIRDNERFEFLGDSVLNLVVSHELLKVYPEATEGELSKLRAGLVNEKTLAEIAKSLSLGDFLLLGKGEERTGGRDKESILASTLEALFAAIFLDSGFDAAGEVIRSFFEQRILGVDTTNKNQDFKTKLQEVVQAKFKTTPKYILVQSTGPDHDKTFEVELFIQEKSITKAVGKSKKEAEQRAARIALQELDK